MRLLRAAWLALCIALLPWPRARADDAALLRRFALLVAANDGGPLRPLLKHAVRDASAFSAVLAELGGVPERDELLLVQPRAASVRSALEKLGAAARSLSAQGTRTELVFYYSGHSDEVGLLLGGERVSYRELRELLQGLAFDVRIAILDSCASGAFTREKGGRARAPFMFDASSAVRGHAFLTSASEDEAAQESDAIGGSFFTHFLVSGLRGAADVSGDGKVTLTEVYRYAFDETLTRTGGTQYGAQHPAYDIRLVGTGDVVLSDLRATSSELYLEADVDGRLFVRDTGGQLLVELTKRAGKARALALPPARYTVELVREQSLWRASAHTQARGRATLTMHDFQAVGRLATRARGATYTVVPAAAALVRKLSTNRLAHSDDVLNHFNFSLIYDRPASVAGAQWSLGGALARDSVRGLQLAPFFASTPELLGVQLSGVSHSERGRGVALGTAVALASDAFAGLQAAPVTWSRQITGVQFGAVNVAREVAGLQAGILNVATSRVRGVALGLFNYAEEADVSLAPIAYTRRGGAHAQLAVSDTSLVELSVRLDATYNYSFVGVGVHPIGADARRGYSVGAGLGAKLPLWQSALWLDIELALRFVQPELKWVRGVPNTLQQLRLLLRYELFNHLSFFVGPALNVLVQRDAAERDDLGFAIHRARLSNADADVRVLLWPGFAVGIRL